MRRILSLKPILVGLVLLLTSCGSYFNQPTQVQEARLGEITEVTKSLRDLPAAADPLYVAVYNFRDQTGQYKPTDLGSTFSTAVTQGATSIMVKALKDSGFFIPVERENLQNLANERRIIESTNESQLRRNPNATPYVLDPLLFAGILIEGGVISYDSNTITGGFGARYFGTGGSTQYRQDRVTVYLRAVSVRTGQIMKTVYISKSILSQSLDGGFFRYVKLRRLLEVETGFTFNEPAQLAVAESIEKGVEALIIEGLEEGLWRAQGTDAEVQKVIDDYRAEKEIADDTRLFSRFFEERRTPTSFGITGGGSLYDGDFGGAEMNPRVGISFDQKISNNFRLRESIGLSQLSADRAFQNDFNDVGIDAKYIILPFEEFSPFATGGLGYYLENNDFSFDFSDRSFFKAQYGFGLEYMAKDKLSLAGEVNHNLVFSDELENLPQGVAGRRDDQYFSFGLGVNFYLGKKSTEGETTPIQ